MTADTELTYEYGVRTDKKSPATPATDQDKGEMSHSYDINYYMTLYNHSIAQPTCIFCLTDCYLYTITAEASATSSSAKVPPLSIDGKPHLPFQLQIEYTAQDGSRNRRVITDAKPTTSERQVAERGMGALLKT